MFHVKHSSDLQTYADLLEQWQRTINLVAPSTLPDVWHRHFADSRPAPGAGAPPTPSAGSISAPAPDFPGLVVALMLAGRDGRSE